jgi:hypothetical protein
MYDYEEMRAYNMPTSEDSAPTQAPPAHEPSVPMTLCEKVIATVVVTGIVATFSGLGYLWLAGRQHQKEMKEQQQREHIQQWKQNSLKNDLLPPYARK